MMLQGVIFDTNVHIKPMWEQLQLDEFSPPQTDEQLKPQTLDEEVCACLRCVLGTSAAALTLSLLCSQANKLTLVDMRMQMREWGKNEWLSE